MLSTIITSHSRCIREQFWLTMLSIWPNMVIWTIRYRLTLSIVGDTMSMTTYRGKRYWIIWSLFFIIHLASKNLKLFMYEPNIIYLFFFLIFIFFQTFLVDVIGSGYGKIVTSPINRDETKLKRLLTKWACEILAIPGCIRNAQRDYRNMLSNGTLVVSQKSPYDLKILLCTVIKNGGLDEWNTVRASFSSTDFIYNSVLMKALGCASDSSLISVYTNFIVKTEFKRHVPDFFEAIVENRFLRLYFLDYLNDNFEAVWNVAGYANIYKLMESLSTKQELKMVRLDILLT